MANLAALSGPAARMGLVLLLGEGQALRLEEVGAAVGVRRLATLREAAGQLLAAGIARRLVAPDGSALLVPLYSASTLDRPTEERGRELVIDRDTDTRFTRIPSDRLSIYREASQTGASEREGLAGFRVPSDQAVNVGTESVRTESVLRSTESVLPSTESVHASTESVRRGTESVLDSTESVLQADDDLMLAVEMADRLERGEPTNQRNSPYIRRRNAQVAALQALWRSTFQMTPPTRESVVSLLRLTADDASVVAEMMQDVGERVVGGLKVQSLYGYVRKTIENRMREKPRVSPTSQPKRAVEGEESLAPPTPEFLAQMARTQKLAALWGDE